MPASQNINIDLILEFLTVAQTSEVKGATAKEICAATGLSKATVHRAINACEAIHQNYVGGKYVPTYYVDHAKLLDWRLSVKTGGRSRNGLTFKTLDSAFPKRYLAQQHFNILNELGTYTKDESLQDFVVLKDAFVAADAIHKDGNAEPMTEDDVTRYRAAIGRLQSYALRLLVYTNYLQSHRHYAETSQFYKLFPKYNPPVGEDHEG